jgi:hypothetical protein
VAVALVIYTQAAAGGSGIIILSVPSANYSGATTGSPTVTTSGSNTILTFTGSWDIHSIRRKQMAHFAKIGLNNIVTDVLVVANRETMDSNGVEHESIGVEFLKNSDRP